jgi:CIC family chloride channel protein
MIAAARALVSVIALDEEILLSFKQQQSFDYHNIIFYILLGLFTGFISVYYSVTREWNNFLKVLNYHLIKKALFGSSILAILIFIFPNAFGEGYESIKTLSDNDPGNYWKHII